MSYILSIIASPQQPVLDEAFCDALRQAFPESSVNELAPGIAYELPVIQRNSRVYKDAKMALADRPADINIIPTDSRPAANRRKKLLIADMDSTIIEQECIDEIADFAGKRKEIAEITERAMRGELDFDAALKQRVWMLKGLPQTVLEETFAQRLTLTPGAKTLVETMNAQGAITALVSGGFTFFTGRIAKNVGFQFTQANELLIADDALTGHVATPILGRTAKQNALIRIAEQHKIAMEETIAVGDGANDLAMLGRANLGVAFHAKPKVAEAADARIDHGDLTALLYLQGIAQAEFVN